MIENLFINRYATITELREMSIFELNYWHEKWAKADKVEQRYNADEAAKFKALTG